MCIHMYICIITISETSPLMVAVRLSVSRGAEPTEMSLELRLFPEFKHHKCCALFIPHFFYIKAHQVTTFIAQNWERNLKCTANGTHMTF